MKHSRTDATELAASALAMAPTERAVLPAALAGTTSGGLPDRVALYVIAVVGVFAVLWLPRLVFSPWLDPRGLRALLAPAALSHVALVFFLFVLSLPEPPKPIGRSVPSSWLPHWWCRSWGSSVKKRSSRSAVRSSAR